MTLGVFRPMVLGAASGWEPCRCMSSHRPSAHLSPGFFMCSMEGLAETDRVSHLMSPPPPPRPNPLLHPHPVTEAGRDWAMTGPMETSSPNPGKSSGCLPSWKQPPGLLLLPWDLTSAPATASSLPPCRQAGMGPPGASRVGGVAPGDSPSPTWVVSSVNLLWPPTPGLAPSPLCLTPPR